MMFEISKNLKLIDVLSWEYQVTREVPWNISKNLQSWVELGQFRINIQI